MKSITGKAASLAAMIVVAGCATGGASTSSELVPGADQQVVQVHNRSWEAVSVYAVRGSTPAGAGGGAGDGALPAAARDARAHGEAPVRVGDNAFVKLDVEREIRLSSVAVFAHRFR